MGWKKLFVGEKMPEMCIRDRYYAQQIAKIREHYQAAEVAAAGIFSSKFLDRRALTNLGLWTSAHWPNSMELF